MSSKNLPLATGAIPSGIDYRTRLVAAAVNAAASALIPPSLPVNFNTTLGPVLMQALEPACVAHSAVDNLKLYWFRKTGVWIDFSPRFLDILAKRFDNQAIDAGTYPQLVFKLMVQYGCATTATLPNDTTLPIAQYRNDALLTPAVFAEASKYKTPGYVGVPVTLADTRYAIYLYGAISTLFQIGQEFWTPSWADKDIDPLRTPALIESGHQLTPKGWNGPANNILRNEWSDLWANKGEAQYNFSQWAPFIIEQWAIAEIPPDTADFLKLLPAPANFHYIFQNAMEFGQQSDDVKFLQVALMILGHLKTIQPDELGYYGMKTAAAVLLFQTASNIAPTAPNNVGPKTRVALNARFAV